MEVDSDRRSLNACLASHCGRLHGTMPAEEGVAPHSLALPPLTDICPTGYQFSWGFFMPTHMEVSPCVRILISPGLLGRIPEVTRIGRGWYRGELWDVTTSENKSYV